MAPARTDSAVEHKRGSRVVLTEDIPGVPEGTAGRLGRVVGFALKRYRVRFDNDVEVMSVAHGILVSEKDWPGVRTDRAEQARTAAEAAALAAEARAAAAQTAAVADAAPSDAAPAAEPAPPAEPAQPEAAPSADPRLAALMARSESARKESGVTKPASPEAAPPTEPAPAGEAAPGETAPAEPAPPASIAGIIHDDPPPADIEVDEPEPFIPGPEVEPGYYSSGDRISELLAKVRGTRR